MRLPRGRKAEIFTIFGYGLFRLSAFGAGRLPGFQKFKNGIAPDFQPTAVRQMADGALFL
jgi:hypothetical protein